MGYLKSKTASRAGWKPVSSASKVVIVDLDKITRKMEQEWIGSSFQNSFDDSIVIDSTLKMSHDMVFFLALNETPGKLLAF